MSTLVACLCRWGRSRGLAINPNHRSWVAIVAQNPGANLLPKAKMSKCRHQVRPMDAIKLLLSVYGQEQYFSIGAFGLVDLVEDSLGVVAALPLWDKACLVWGYRAGHQWIQMGH